MQNLTPSSWQLHAKPHTFKLATPCKTSHLQAGNSMQHLTPSSWQLHAKPLTWLRILLSVLLWSPCHLWHGNELITDLAFLGLLQTKQQFSVTKTNWQLLVPTTSFKQPPAGKHHIVAASCRLLAKRAVPAKLQLISFCNEVLYSPGPSNSENQRLLCNFETLYQDSKLITDSFPTISGPANSIFSPSWLAFPVSLQLLQLTDLKL